MPNYPLPNAPILEENYYLRLGLPVEPPVTDAPTLSKRVDDMAALWSRTTNNPSTGAICAKYIAEKEIIRNGVAACVGDAQKEIAARFSKAANMLVGGKGFLKSDEVKKLEGQFGIWLPKLDKKIVGEFGRYSIDPIAKWLVWPKEPKRTGVPPTPNNTMDDWATSLGILGKKNIYDFLDLSSGASVADILSKSDEIYNDASRNNNKTPVVTVTQTLAGKLRTYFKATPNGKGAYDEALKTYSQWKEVERSALDQRIVKDDKGKLTPIPFEAYQKCVIQAMEGGFDADEAQWRVFDWFVNKKKAIILSPAGSERECPKCKKKNPFSIHTCSQCGFVFEIQCPKCAANHEDVWVACDKPICEKCGGKIADLYKAETEHKEAFVHFNSGKLDEAEKLANAALSHWNGHEGSVTLLLNIKNKRADIARKAAAEAERIKRETAERFRNGLKLSGAVSASVSKKEDMVRLGWGAAVATVAGGDASKITYRVVRKAAGQPTGPQDGEKISEQRGISCDDTKPDVGRSCYYAVYACYEGMPNNAGICSSTAVLVTPEAVPKPVKPRPNQLELSWKLPPNAIGVVCRRKKGGDPVSATDGEAVNVTFPPGDRLTDKGLENETYYGYRVCVIFAGTDGRPVQTTGTLLRGSPSEESLVPKVKDPRVKRVAGNLQVTWKWPDGCAEALVLYRSDAKPDGPDDKIATKRRVTKREYDAEDAYYIEGCGDGTYHVAVCAADTNSTETQYSEPEYADSFGAKDMAQLTYRVAPMRKGFLGMGGFGGATLSVRVSNGSGVRPALCLVEGIRLPTSKADGVCVVPEFPEEKMGDKLETTLNAPMAKQGWFYRLFFTNQEDEARYFISHPENSKL